MYIHSYIYNDVHTVASIRVPLLDYVRIETDVDDMVFLHVFPLPNMAHSFLHLGFSILAPPISFWPWKKTFPRNRADDHTLAQAWFRQREGKIPKTNPWLPNDSKPAWSFLWLNSSTVGLGSATMPWYASSLQEFLEIHLALAEQFIAIPMAKHVAHLRHHGVRPVGLRVLWSWGC